MKIDLSIKNGEYPNVKKMNEKHGWDFSRRRIGRYIDIKKNDYDAPIEYDF